MTTMCFAVPLTARRLRRAPSPPCGERVIANGGGEGGYGGGDAERGAEKESGADEARVPPWLALATLRAIHPPPKGRGKRVCCAVIIIISAVMGRRRGLTCCTPWHSSTRSVFVNGSSE